MLRGFDSAACSSFRCACTNEGWDTAPVTLQALTSLGPTRDLHTTTLGWLNGSDGTVLQWKRLSVNEHGSSARVRRAAPVFDVPSKEYAVSVTVCVPWLTMHIDREEFLLFVQLPRCKMCVQLLLQPLCGVGYHRQGVRHCTCVYALSNFGHLMIGTSRIVQGDPSIFKVETRGRKLVSDTTMYSNNWVDGKWQLLKGSHE